MTGLMNTWQIGDFTVSRIVEMEVAGGTKFILPDATREAASEISWLQPHFMDDDGRLIMSIHALVIDTGEQRIIVDTCIGNDKQRSVPSWTNLQTDFLQDLEAAGYPRESIDTVCAPIFMLIMWGGTPCSSTANGYRPSQTPGIYWQRKSSTSG